MSESIEIVSIGNIVHNGHPALQLKIRNAGSKRCDGPSIYCGEYAADGSTLNKRRVIFASLEPGEQGSATLSSRDLLSNAASCKLLALEWLEEGQMRSVPINRDAGLKSWDNAQRGKGRKLLIVIAVIIVASALWTVVTSFF